MVQNSSRGLEVAVYLCPFSSFTSACELLLLCDFLNLTLKLRALSTCAASSNHDESHRLREKIFIQVSPFQGMRVREKVGAGGCKSTEPTSACRRRTPSPRAPLTSSPSPSPFERLVSPHLEPASRRQPSIHDQE